jgi:hypothetical protein
MPVSGGTQTKGLQDLLEKQKISPDGKYLVYNEEVKLNNVLGKDIQN